MAGPPEKERRDTGNHEAAAAAQKAEPATAEAPTRAAAGSASRPAAEPQAAPAAPPVAADDELVYITPHGQRYHRKEGQFAKSAAPVKLAEAKARKLTPCARCKPPQ